MASLFLPQWWISRREKGVSKCIHLLNDVYEVYSHSGKLTDYSICKALSYNMVDIPVTLVMYDIMCQYGVHRLERMDKSSELILDKSLELWTGIGLFHIHGNQNLCLPRYSLSYIPGAKQVDGEIIETLWAPLNNISQSICGMSLAHQQEVLDAHMKHSNWKKMVRIGA